MDTRPTLDRESFEKLLANAFAVQNSHLDRQSLSVVIDVERLIQKGKLDLDGTVRLVADYARNVADATGICIGLLKGNQLVFRAGSGSGAVYVGQQVMASLTVSAESNASGEILRVENADVDTRIDAAICRQFGAKALLILPIYHGRTIAGVVEILFSEPHAFEDRELRTYRLLAGLVGEVMSHATQVEAAKKVAKNQTVPLAPTVSPVPPIASRPPEVVKSTVPIAVRAERPMFSQPGEVSTGTGSFRKTVILEQGIAWGAAIFERGKRLVRESGRPGRGTAALAAVFLLVAASWMAYSSRRAASPVQSSAKPESVGVEQQPIRPTRTASEATPKPRTGTVRRQRRRTGSTEVEYIGDDVTVRHFTPKPAPNRVLVGSNKVHHIGDDVTVRYFTTKPAIVQAKQPVAR